MRKLILRWKDSLGVAQSLALSAEHVSIGRLADSDVLIEAPEVSRKHAVIHAVDGHLTLEDLNSSHGTYVRGVRIKQQELRVGDRFSVVHTEFEVFAAEDAVTEIDEVSAVAPDITAFINLTMGQTAEGDERSGLEKLSALLDLEYRWKQQFPAEEMFRQILESAVEISGAQRAFILRRHGDDFRYAMGLDSHLQQLQEEDFQVSRTLVRHVIETRQPVFETTGITENLALQESIIAQKLHALACLPLMGIDAAHTSSDVVGVLYLDSRKSMHALTGLDERILRKLAVETGNVLEKMQLIRTLEEARLHEKELELAQEAQLHLLPQRNPDFAGFRIVAVSQPTRYVGGDFYDFLVADDVLNIILADVSGKGISASLLSASLQSALHMQLQQRPAADALEAVNQYLCGRTEDERFATLFLLQAHNNGDCLYLSAGHIPSYLYRATNREIEELVVGNLILGMFDSVSYQSCEVHMEVGDVAVILSDGLTEADNKRGELFGEERLKRLIWQHASEGAEVLKERILKAINTFVEGHEQADDITLVLLERVAP